MTPEPRTVSRGPPVLSGRVAPTMPACLDGRTVHLLVVLAVLFALLFAFAPFVVLVEDCAPPAASLNEARDWDERSRRARTLDSIVDRYEGGTPPTRDSGGGGGNETVDDEDDDDDDDDGDGGAKEEEEEEE